MHASLTNAQETDVTKETGRGFDLVKILHEAPVLAGFLRNSWNHFGDGLNAYRFEGFVDVRTVFRAGIDFTRLDHDQPGRGELKRLDRVVTVLHIPLKRLTLISGGGWEWNQTPATHSGPATYFSVEVHPTVYTRLEILSIHSVSNRRYNDETNLGFSVGVKQIRVQGEYRWIHADRETVSGPGLGLTIRF